jgi:hypothetical protein
MGWKMWYDRSNLIDLLIASLFELFFLIALKKQGAHASQEYALRRFYLLFVLCFPLVGLLGR